MWGVICLLAGLVAGARGQGLPCPPECECFFNTHAMLQADCSSRKLYQLPDGLDTQTQILDMSNNLFESIPRQISALTNLETLNFSGNQIIALSGDTLVNLTLLDILDLSNNRITNWEDINPPSLLLPASNLRILNLSRNPFNNFANLKATEMLISRSLHTLELNNCGISSIHGKSPISGLIELRHLSMTHNPLKRLQKLVSPTLHSLDLSHSELSFIGSDELNYLPTLIHLTLSHNYRLTLNQIDNLNSVSLKTIDLSYCNMNKVSLSGFPNIEEANLRGNMVRRLNAGDFTNNSRLISLDLSSNAVEYIHKNAFDGLNSLRYLNLSVNVIPVINSDTFIKTANLSVLNMARNYLTTVEALSSASLMSIDFSLCEIQGFTSDALEGLPLLRDINLSRNLIHNIPDNLRSRSLQTLDLSYNRLSTMNNLTFHLLPELTNLNLEANRFTETLKADYFVNNPKLSDISMRDNTWRCDCGENDMKLFFDYLSIDPPKVWNVNDLMCHSPSNLSGRNWLEACYFIWNPEFTLSHNQRVLTFMLIVFAGFFLTCFTVMLVRRAMALRLKTAQEERERDAEAARDRLREIRMRREQEEQRNAPDPRDLISPPSYDEALLMPKLDGSYHSLAGVGVGQDAEKKPERRRRARRRTRSSGDLCDEEGTPQRLRNRRRRSSKTGRAQDADSAVVTESSNLMACRSEGNILAATADRADRAHRLHESDL